MEALLVILTLAIAGYLILTYNRFIKQRQKVGEAWSGVDVQLKKRHDLVPVLVETVKAYSEHETQTLEEVTKKRSLATATRASEPTDSDLNNISQMEASLASNIKTIFALAEDYPELKANENFIGLQNQLVEIEDDLQHARRYFNGTVRDWNTMSQIFPANIIASCFNFKTREFFSLSYASERKNPDVDF